MSIASVKREVEKMLVYGDHHAILPGHRLGQNALPA